MRPAWVAWPADPPDILAPRSSRRTLGRRAIVRSPVTPHPISLALIAEMNQTDLRDLAQSDDVPPLIAAVARRILG